MCHLAVHLLGLRWEQPISRVWAEVPATQIWILRIFSPWDVRNKHLKPGRASCPAGARVWARRARGLCPLWTLGWSTGAPEILLRKHSSALSCQALQRQEKQDKSEVGMGGCSSWALGKRRAVKCLSCWFGAQISHLPTAASEIFFAIIISKC